MLIKFQREFDEENISFPLKYVENVCVLPYESTYWNCFWKESGVAAILPYTQGQVTHSESQHWNRHGRTHPDCLSDTDYSHSFQQLIHMRNSNVCVYILAQFLDHPTQCVEFHLITNHTQFPSLLSTGPGAIFKLLCYGQFTFQAIRDHSTLSQAVCTHYTRPERTVFFSEGQSIQWLTYIPWKFKVRPQRECLNYYAVVAMKYAQPNLE